MTLPKQKFSKITTKDVNFLKSLVITEPTVIYCNRKHGLELIAYVDSFDYPRFTIMIDGYPFVKDVMTVRKLVDPYNDLLEQVKICADVLPNVPMRYKIKRGLAIMLPKLHCTTIKRCTRVLEEVRATPITPFSTSLNDFSTLEEKQANIDILEYIITLVKA